MVVGKAHGHHMGKVLHLVALQNTALVTPVSFYALSVQFSGAGQSSCDQKLGNRFTKGTKSGTESGKPFIGFQLVRTYIICL